MWQDLPLWPARASTLAGRVDAYYTFMIAVAGFFALLVFLLVVVFAIRYRRAKHPVAEQIEGSVALELTWTFIPLGIAMVMFTWGAVIYVDETRPPKGAMDIYVVGKQWMWKIQHMDGQREINELHVPIGRDVKLTMISQDVIHSFFIPAFRIKQDVLPGRYTSIWFHAIKPGKYHLFCAEYCGTQHSGMIGQVVALEPRDYEQWLAGGAGEGSLAKTGEKLFQELGCSTCHRFDTQGRGPYLVGLYGKTVLLDDGRSVTADDNYIRESILNPGAKVVSGFKPIMPTFQGVVAEEQLLALISYIKSLQPPPGGPVTPPSAQRQPAAIPGAAAPDAQKTK